MKLSTVPVVLAAAVGLVSAAPVRIYVFTPKPRVPVPDVIPPWAQSIRWGHAAAPAFNLPALEPTPPRATYRPTPTDIPFRASRPDWTPDPEWIRFGETPSPTYWPSPTYRPVPTGFLLPPPPDPEWIKFGERLRAQLRDGKAHRGGCRMKAMRAKSLQWGNKLRVILGLPLIDNFQLPSFAVESLVDGDGTVIYRKEIPINRLPTHHRHHMRPLHHRSSFMIRLSHALASLGPWEGRAVSFVLGCGLGVLLRMLFVFGVLIVRSVRARRVERRIVLEEDSVVFVADVKEPVVVETLPGYAEKAEAEESPQTNNAL